MESIVLIVHVLLAAAIIALVLLQQGKGAEAGASFGAGASQTVFGSTGTGSFLARMTGLVAAGVFATSFVLAIFAAEKAKTVGDAGIPSVEVVESVAPQSEEPELPALQSTPQKADKPAKTDVPTAE